MPTLNHVFQLQSTGYWCGPASVRVALSAQGQIHSQSELATSLGTTTAGTNSSDDIVRTLNHYLGAGTYRDVWISGHDATTAQRDQLKADIKASIDAGYAVVANVVGTISTNDGHSYTYSGGHYVCITGYDGDNVFVSDIAVREYWTTVGRMATWIAERSYSTLAKVPAVTPPAPTVSSSSDPQWLIDIASYQVGINLDVAKASGVEIVNIKNSEGTSYVFPEGPAYAAKARTIGLSISTFHYLRAGSSGAAQAQYAYNQMLKIGGGTTDGLMHAVDCESDATFQIWQDYVNWMQDKLGRHIMSYTGDWWWVPRGWNGAALTPYLYAAPNEGYPGTYPGDNSPQWNAGYGGWSVLSGIQYAVKPILNAGGGNISQTKLRPGVFNALAGNNPTGTTGVDDVTAQDVWAYEIGSPSLGYSAQAGEWLKFTVEGSRADARIEGLIKAGFAADATRDAASGAAIGALSDALKAALGGSGGTIDTAPILAAINAAAEETRGAVTELHNQLQDSLAEAEDLRRRLSAALADAPTK